MIASSSRDYTTANSSKRPTSSGIDIRLHVGSAIIDDLKMEMLDGHPVLICHCHTPLENFMAKRKLLAWAYAAFRKVGFESC